MKTSSNAEQGAPEGAEFIGICPLSGQSIYYRCVRPRRSYDWWDGRAWCRSLGDPAVGSGELRRLRPTETELLSGQNEMLNRKLVDAQRQLYYAQARISKLESLALIAGEELRAMQEAKKHYANTSARVWRNRLIAELCVALFALVAVVGIFNLYQWVSQ